MDVGLLRQGGIYEVEGASGQSYRVDVIEQSCTCPDAQTRDPDGGCKHLRCVDLELEQGTIPRPDGKLPASALEMTAVGMHNGAAAADGDYQRDRAAIIDAIQEREVKLARLHAEIDALEFVMNTLKTVADPDASFSLDAIRPEEE